MPRTRSCYTPAVDSLETRLALATASVGAETTLTPAEYHEARSRINVAVIRQAQTHNLEFAEVSLARAVERVPNGATLLPTLVSELAAGDLSSRGTAIFARNQLAGSLDTFIQAGVSAGTITVTGRALQNRFPATTATAPGAINYYFPVINNSNQVVTFNLTQPNNQQSPFTTTIYNTTAPANVPFTANATPSVTVTVTNFDGSIILGQTTLPAVVHKIQLTPNGTGVNITIT